MEPSQVFLQWLNKSKHIANLKALVAVQSFVLIMGTLIIDPGHRGGHAGPAVLFAAYQVFSAFLANFRYRNACLLIAIPNLLIAGIFVMNSIAYEFPSEPIPRLWFWSTLGLGVGALLLSRVRDVPSQSSR